MSELIARLFIKDYKNYSDPIVRQHYGKLTGWMGVIVNLVLFAGKYLAGILTMSLSITADAINNLSDAGSSVISLISVKISSKPADREHPFGHGRIEYVASLLISFLIIHIGINLAADSVDKIFHPGNTVFSYLSIGILAASILLKLWLYYFNSATGKRIGSTVMTATAADSLSDVAATTAVLISTLIFKFTGFDTDGYMGVLVAVFILISGVKILNESKNRILGTAPDPALIRDIETSVREYPEVLGIHDLVLHNYGPGQYFASLHVEVDGKKDVFHTHDVIDNIERELSHKYGIRCSVHMDPIVTDDESVRDLREKVGQILNEIDPSLTMHDFRTVPGPTHTNLIFDLVVPYECKTEPDALKQTIAERVSAFNPTCFTVITIDKG